MALRRDPAGDNSYAGFGRVVDHQWYDYGSSQYADRFRHGYDRNSNRLWRENTLAVGYDERYAYDGLNRLTDMDRGTLNAQRDSIASATFAQGWGLDPLGNWAGFGEDADGDGVDDLAQSRTHGDANEITDIGETAGASWATPGHDRAGNMTTLPQPEAPAESFTATYDAWNRLVELEDVAAAATVSEYEYDGRGRRIVKKTYDSGTIDETRHFYYTNKLQVFEIPVQVGSSQRYTNQWQVLEERIGETSEMADVNRQYVWGVRYADALLKRMSDHNGDGIFDQTLYALQDANYNTTAIVNENSSVVEHYSYNSYGQISVLDADFTIDEDGYSDYSWETFYAGYRYDSESGFYYVRNRMYHPLLGRWMQREVLVYLQSMNLRVYVSSNPLNRVDVDGRCWGIVGGAVGGLVGGVLGGVGGAVAGTVAEAIDVAQGGSFDVDTIGAFARNGAIGGAVGGAVLGAAASGDAVTASAAAAAGIVAAGGTGSGVVATVSSGVAVGVSVGLANNDPPC